VTGRASHGGSGPASFPLDWVRLRLDGVLLDEPSNEWQEGDHVVTDYALPGCSTGDLLSVRLVSTS
jgi:hypothetical protein